MCAASADADAAAVVDGVAGSAAAAAAWLVLVVEGVCEVFHFSRRGAA